jgi:hypothetical protein
MANEFVARNGIIALDNSQITGSLNVSNGITGSLHGTASWALNSISASYFSGSISSAVSAETASYLNPLQQDVTITGSLLVTQSSISTVDWIDFNIAAATPPHLEGRIHWDEDRKTLQIDTDTENFVISAGHVNVLRGRNTNSYTLNAGTVVYISGNSGQFATFNTASWDNEASSAYTIGILPQAISPNQFGYAVIQGEITGINTNGFPPGTLLYLSSSGQYTSQIPVAPKHSVRLGQVIVASTSGILQVKVDNGYELGELHDIRDTSTTSSYGDLLVKSGSVWINSKQLTGSYGLTGSLQATSFTGSLFGTASYALDTPIAYIDNLITVGLSGSDVNYNSIKAAVDSITDSSVNNTYTVRVYPGVYIEDTITLKSFVSVIGDGPESTVVSASNASSSLFLGADQAYISDMKIQGVTAPSQSAILYYTSQSVASQGILYVENVRFGNNYTHAKMHPVSGGNAAMQLTNIKYGAQPFTLGFYITSDGISTGRMLLRNVTTTAGGIQSTTGLVFAKTDQPNCTLLGNLVGLTKVGSGPAQGTAFWVENGGLLRINTANLQRFSTGIYAPQVGSAPTIDAVGLNFENCTTDVLIQHTGSLGKVSGTDSFLKTQIALNAPLYEVGQDPRIITVAKKGGDFSSVSASVAYITDSSENNRYIIKVGPGAFTENEIDLSNKPYVSVIGSDIQATEIFASGSNHNIFKLGNTSEVSFMTLRGAGVGCAAFDCTDIDGFSLVHKVSIYDCDYGVKLVSNVSSSTFFGEYIDINGAFNYGVYVSSSNGALADANMENYYLFPSASVTIGNFAVGQSASLSLYTSKFLGDSTANSIAIKLQDGSTLEAASLDIQAWDYGYVVPNIGAGPEFRVVGSMVHDTITYDFDVQNTATRGRYQGVSNHQKINNVSENFYWNFLDDEDGENDVTRKLSVTFADGTHTDATTLIFRGSPMGLQAGGTITISGSLTITTAAGFGYLHDPINTEVFKRFDWVDGNITLSPNTNNYIYINSNGILSAAGTVPNYAQNIILGRVVTNATGVEFIDQSPWNAEHTANALSKFNREALGPVFAEGSIVSEDAIPFRLDVTQGNYYFSENNFLPVGTSSINLTQYYISASTWARYTSSVVPNNVYASGSSLVPMSSSYYTKHTVYLVGDGADEEYFLVINDNQYASLVQTENADLPTIPTYFNDGVVPLAAVYVQSGSSNITQIQDIRPIIGFRAAGVNASSVHGNLLGLNADDHTQYLRVDGFRQMTGDLGLGGNDLYNFSSVSGSSITASGATITDINAVAANITSITGSLLGNASSATTASYVLNAVSSSFASIATSASFAPNLYNSNGTLTGNRILTLSGSFLDISGSTATRFFANGRVGVGTTVDAGYQFEVNGSSRFRDIFIVQDRGIYVDQNSSVRPNIYFGTTGIFNNNWSFVPNVNGGIVVGSTYQLVSSPSAIFEINSTTRGFLPPRMTLAQRTAIATPITGLQVYQTSSIEGQYVNLSTGWDRFLTTRDSGSFNWVSSSFALTASFALNAGEGSSFPFTGSAIISGSLIVTGSITSTLGFTGSLLGTSSWAHNSTTASFVATASWANNAITASYILNAVSASFATNATNASTASFVLNAVSSSFATQAQTASFAPLYLLTSTTASMLAPYLLSSQTASFITSAQTSSMSVLSASFATSASFAPNIYNSNGTLTGARTVTLGGNPLDIAGTSTSRFFANGRVGIGTTTDAGFLFDVNGTTRFRGDSWIDSTDAGQNVLRVGSNTNVYFTVSSLGGVAGRSFQTNAGNTIIRNDGTVQITSTLNSLSSLTVGEYSASGNLLAFRDINTTQFMFWNRAGLQFGNNANAVPSALVEFNSTSKGFLPPRMTLAQRIAIGTPAVGLIVYETGSSVTEGLWLNESTGWHQLLTSTGSQSINGSLTATSFTGSLFGTASWAVNATSASYVLNAVSSSFATTASFAVSASWAPSTGGGGGLRTKAGSVANTSFTSNPRKATVTFSTAFTDTNYAVVVTGEDARSWTIESKLAGSFVINANSNPALSGTTYWIATAYGETT